MNKAIPIGGYKRTAASTETIIEYSDGTTRTFRTRGRLPLKARILAALKVLFNE